MSLFWHTQPWSGPEARTSSQPTSQWCQWLPKVFDPSYQCFWWEPEADSYTGLPTSTIYPGLTRSSRGSKLVELHSCPGFSRQWPEAGWSSQWPQKPWHSFQSQHRPESLPFQPILSATSYIQPAARWFAKQLLCKVNEDVDTRDLLQHIDANTHKGGSAMLEAAKAPNTHVGDVGVAQICLWTHHLKSKHLTARSWKSAHTALAVKACLLGCNRLH